MRLLVRLCPLALLAPSFLCLAQTPASTQNVKCITVAIPNTPADQAFVSGDSSKAEALFTSQLQSAPTDVNFAGLVRAQLEQNKLPEALSSAQKAVASLPKSADALATLADAQLRSGKPIDAFITYAKAITLDSCSAHAHFGFARLNEAMARHQIANDQFTIARRLSPGDPSVLLAYLETLPTERRLPSLRALAAAHPALTPDQRDKLNTEIAISDQHLTCTATTPLTAATIPLEPIYLTGHQIRSWGIRVHTNDAAPTVLELDTTVDGIVLSADDALKAHVRPLISPAPSSDIIYQGAADDIHIGDLTWHNCPVTVIPSSIVGKFNSLIGTGFFRDHLIHIDYVSKTIALATLPAAPTGETLPTAEKDWTPVLVSGSRLIMPIWLNKKAPYLFALDTGNFVSILSPATAKQFSAGKITRLNVIGYSGNLVKLYSRLTSTAFNEVDIRDPKGTRLTVTTPDYDKLVNMVVGRAELNRRPTISFDISPFSHNSGIEIDGLLGFANLRNYAIDIDYRNGLVNLVYDVNQRYDLRTRGETLR
jgi:hypothetical protein